MNKDQIIQSYFNSQNLQDGFWVFVADLLLTAVLSYILSKIYIKYGNSHSNRTSFAANFVILALTTMTIITVIKSSLALSLGLVGALSIVRFRSAIKEPEELSYLFLTIALGLGFGAGQRYITLVAFFVILAIVVLRSRYTIRNIEQNLYLTITSQALDKLTIEKVSEVLKEYSNFVHLKRLDKSADFVEVFFHIKLDNLDQLNSVENSLRALDNNIKVSFIEDRGVLS